MSTPTASTVTEVEPLYPMLQHSIAVHVSPCYRFSGAELLKCQTSTCTKPLPFRVFDLFIRNAVSNRLNSHAINCSHSSSLSFGKINTAAGLPLYARSMNASICQFINNLHQSINLTPQLTGIRLTHIPDGSASKSICSQLNFLMLVTSKIFNMEYW
jgi:hypothetical protein